MVKILCAISIFHHVLTVVRYLAKSRKTLCNITCSIGQPPRKCASSPQIFFALLKTVIVYSRYHGLTFPLW